MYRFELGVVIPTYGAFEYAEDAVTTALNRSVSDICVLIVDDASPDWAEKGAPMLQRLQREWGADKVRCNQFVQNGGLTRSWNYGLNYFSQPEAMCVNICVANSDLLFSEGWDEPLLVGAEQYALAGPVTNAPGTVELQNVRRYLMDYKVSDDMEDIDRQGSQLNRTQQGRRLIHKVNGFCMVARRETWDRGRYDSEHIFKPSNPFNSKGQPNPTPLMTLNEDELQARWTAVGLHSVICPSSFVFHYRSVSRGEKFAKGQGVRK